MPNLLQQPPQQQMPQGMGMQQPQMQGAQPQMQGMPQQPQQPPSLQQIQDLHSHLSYMQQMLNGLIKKPDSELNLRTLFDGAADAVLEFQTSGGKKGVSPQIIATEMSDPNFPTASSSASQIRQFLQGYFDKAIISQATVTHQFGGPQQPQQQMPQQGNPPQ